jgi:iron(III) transport system permease protein
VATIAVVLPLVFLVTQAVQVGWGSLHPLLFRSLTAQLIWHTVSLTVVVTLLCAVIGTVSAWFIERTQLPGRRVWAVLVVIPLGIPDFVVSFGWRAIFPAFGGFWSATLVMTLAVYPLVFLPVAASLRNADPAQEEVARSLGLGRLETFWRVTVGQARLAILGGSVLVGLVVLAEFGAFEILGFNTLTTEIFTEFTVGRNQAEA